MKRRIRLPSHTTVAAYLALFIALATGGAYAADTVFSTDIVDGEVATADLADGAVKTPKLGDSSVASNKVKNENLTGVDVLDDSLKGADIDESSLSGIGAGPAGGDLTGTYPNPTIGPNAVGTTEVIDNSLGSADVSEATLGIVPNASTVDGINSTDIAIARGDNADNGQCSGSLTILDETCADVDLTLPHTGRVVVHGVGSWQMLNGPASADCYVRADNANLGDANFSPLMHVANDGGAAGVNQPVSVEVVTGVLTAGLHTFQFRCNTESGNSTSDIDGAYISAALVGAG